MVEINGVEIDIDLTDADNWGRIQEAVKKMEEFDNQDEYDETDVAACIIHGCLGYELFFDTAFGEGIAEKIFKGNKSLKKHKDAFVSITDMAYEQMNEATDYSDSLQKYSADRVQRNEYVRKRNRNHGRNH